MDEKGRMIVSMLSCIYYMMGLIEGCGCKGSYDFVLESVCEAEKLVLGKVE